MAAKPSQPQPRAKLPIVTATAARMTVRRCRPNQPDDPPHALEGDGAAGAGRSGRLNEPSIMISFVKVDGMKMGFDIM